MATSMTTQSLHTFCALSIMPTISLIEKITRLGRVKVAT